MTKRIYLAMFSLLVLSSNCFARSQTFNCLIVRNGVVAWKGQVPANVPVAFPAKSEIGETMTPVVLTPEALGKMSTNDVDRIQGYVAYVVRNYDFYRSSGGEVTKDQQGFLKIRYFEIGTDGLGPEYQCSLAPESYVTPTDRLCGMQGSISERIQDCATTKLNWSLVSHMQAPGDTKVYDIWKDSKTGLIWGDHLDSLYPYPTDDTNGKKLCANEEAQRANGNISEVSFRLPGLDTYLTAEKDGILDVLPNLQGRWFWSSDYDGDGRKIWNGKGFSGNLGSQGQNYQWYLDEESVRCVGGLPDPVVAPVKAKAATKAMPRKRHKKRRPAPKPAVSYNN